jgi:hypothetical protein
VAGVCAMAVVAVSSVTNKYVWARIVPPKLQCYGACILAVSAGVPDARTMRVGVDYNVWV